MNTPNPTPATPKAPSAQHTPSESALRTARLLFPAASGGVLAQFAATIDEEMHGAALIAERDRLRDALERASGLLSPVASYAAICTARAVITEALTGTTPSESEAEEREAHYHTSERLNAAMRTRENDLSESARLRECNAALLADVATQAAQSSLVMESARALIASFLDTDSNNREANKIKDALLVHRDREWALHERAKAAAGGAG